MLLSHHNRLLYFFFAPVLELLLHPIIKDVLPNLIVETEKPLRYDLMSDLDSEQLDQLVWRIEDQLEEPWHKGLLLTKDLTLREAVVMACGYMRQNITQEV